MLKLYALLVRLFTPLIIFYIRWRLLKGKEDRTRYQERFGKPSYPRPFGKLLWIHAASVGESLSVLPLIRILTNDQTLHVLVTTGTPTSAALMAKNLPERCFHQYIPIDHPLWVSRFLNHWQPTAVIFVESDLWPTLLHNCHQRQTPLILLNARFSPRSRIRWERVPRFLQTLLNHFDIILTQSEDIAQFVRQFRQNNVIVTGNVKFAATPLPYDTEAFNNLKQDINGRHIWVAASTHATEETQIAAIHKALHKTYPDLLTIIVPRHPNRGASIAAELNDFHTSLRTQSPSIPQYCQIYIVDTLGELGLFYALSPIAFVGGSLAPIGGHNPIEPALLDCAVLWGPEIFNFIEVCALLAPAALPVKSVKELNHTIDLLLSNPQQQKMLAQQIKAIVEKQHHVLDHIHTLIHPYIHAPLSQQSSILA